MADPANRYQQLRAAVLQGPGALDPAARRAAFTGEGPPGAEAWVRRVRDQAALIDDADMAALQATGLSEDAIFELTVSAALGEADRRLRAAFATLGKEAP